MAALVAGGAIVVAAAFLAGCSGFGYALLATPLLLAAGFSLSFIVTVNLVIAAVTRTSVAYRLRRQTTRRAWLLLAGSIPGLAVGTLLPTAISETALKTAAGAVVMLAALLLSHRTAAKPKPARPTTVTAAALLGGILGTATSLGGIPLALLYAREHSATDVFFADFAVYTVGSSGLGLGMLGLSGHVGDGALRAAAAWLPGALLLNHVGTSLGLALSAERFRRLTLSLCFAAGALAVAIR
jgi:uncharacterized protein